VSNLRYSMYRETGNHPEKDMRELGITYKYGSGHPMHECWIFWGCDNVPDSLPYFLSNFDVDPMEYIGHGLSREMAEELHNE